MLVRAEASELLSQSLANTYLVLRTLLESCRAIVDSDDTSRVQAAVKRLGLNALAPVAVAF